MDTYCAYFKETTPDKYRFLDFYQYRSKQEDFTFSFQKEADKLLKDLDLILEIGSEEIKKGAIRLKQNFEVIFIIFVEKAVWETSSSPEKG